MRRLRITHTTGFNYDGEVSASYNEARMLPLDTRKQLLLHSTLDIAPVTSRDAYVDYWGTRVTTFESLRPHNSLNLSARSLVELQPREHVPGDVTWDALGGIGDRSKMLSDQLFATEHTDPPAEVAELAKEIAGRSGTPADAARTICDTVGDRLEYVPGATNVTDTASAVWEKQKGVCQDIAHVTLGALRSIGIPARYVSGYLQPSKDPEIGEELSAQSHAWIEWYCGTWTGYDPTNSLEIEDAHVIVGYGRDYHDVAPLRGLYAGSARAALFVNVAITREL